MTCVRCGRVNRTGAAYCDACGAVLSDPASQLFGAPPARAAAGPIFVGREQDLALLRTSLEQAIGGEGRIVSLAGEPGIGKTRTAQVLASEAAALGVSVLWGRCHE